jgi:uncharacterized damage-inducible protein DinB
MSEIDRILDQLKRSFERDAWHGPAVLESLEGVDHERALAHPLPAAHSIWELVLHLIAWKQIVRSRLLGEKVEVTAEMDWPPLSGGTAADWAAAGAALRQAHADLTRVVAGRTDSGLDEAPDGKLSAYILMHGIVQHDLWHAGQIMLLRKA